MIYVLPSWSGVSAVQWHIWYRSCLVLHLGSFSVVTCEKIILCDIRHPTTTSKHVFIRQEIFSSACDLKTTGTNVGGDSLSPVSFEGAPRAHRRLGEVILPFRQFIVSRDTPSSAKALALSLASEKFSWRRGNR